MLRPDATLAQSSIDLQEALSRWHELPLLPANATASPKNQGAESNAVRSIRREKVVMKSENFAYIIRSVALLAVLVLVSPRSAQAGRLGLDLIALFPKDLGDFAYVNLKEARNEKWFAALQTQLLPEQLLQIRNFLLSARIDPDQRVNELAWGFIPASTFPAGAGSFAPVGEQIVGLALGQYDPDSSEAYLTQKKVNTFRTHGCTLFALESSAGPNDLFLTFLDSGTMAFGHRVALEKMLEVRSGMGGSLSENQELFPLIDEANGTGAFWAVLDSAYSKLAMNQLAPEVSQIARSSKLLDRIRNLVLRVNRDNGINGQFQMVLRSTDDANLFGELLQAALLYERYKNKAAFSNALDRAQIFPSGDRVTLRIALDENEVSSLMNDQSLVNR